MMQQTIEDCRGDDRVAEDRTPFAVALVRSENDASSFVTGADQLEENRRAQIVQRQISHLVDDENLRGQVDAQPSIQPAFAVSTPEVGDQIVSRLAGSRPCRPHRKFRRTYFTPDSTLPLVCAR